MQVLLLKHVCEILKRIFFSSSWSSKLIHYYLRTYHLSCKKILRPNPNFLRLYCKTLCLQKLYSRVLQHCQVKRTDVRISNEKQKTLPI